MTEGSNSCRLMPMSRAAHARGGCAEVTLAVLPAGVPTGSFDPCAHTIRTLCTGAYQLSKRTTQCVLADLFGLPLSLGTSVNLEQATAHALAVPVAEFRTHGQTQFTASLDETRWRGGRQRDWLWAAVTTWVTVFIGAAGPQCRRDTGTVGGTVLGLAGDGSLECPQLGFCVVTAALLAHLLRDIGAMGERAGCSGESGTPLWGEGRRMFHDWHRVGDGTLSHTRVAFYRWPIRREVERLLEAGQACGVPKTEGMWRDIFNRRKVLWTFVRHPAWSRPTTPPSGLFSQECSGATGASAHSVGTAPGLLQP